MKKLIIVYFLLLFSAFSFSQEMLLYSGNPTLQKNQKSKNQNFAKVAGDTLELPFVDDFSQSKIYPDLTKWDGKTVFINNSFGANIFSYNVATFDALNENGYVYPHLNAISSKIADSLVSLPINLAYNVADSIYLSFFYQCGGRGNAPEYNDSLVLHFYSADNQWVSVWKKEGGTAMSNFLQVLIPIKDPNFLWKGFKFKFQNYASIGRNSDPSWKSNSDIWNIDYIKLDKNRTIKDTVLADVAFIKNFTSMLNNYESVPCKHYTQYPNPKNLHKNEIVYFIKNNNTEATNLYRMFFLYNTYNSQLLCKGSNDTENIIPYEIMEYHKSINDSCIFDIDVDVDTALFLLKGCINRIEITDPEYTLLNDTISYYQYFDNYYAYDDGSSEAGYGVPYFGAKIATKFDPIIADTLKGVLMYFNNVAGDGNQKYFYLSVWADDDGYPGELLYEMEGIKPQFKGLNQYIYYKLDAILFIDKPFYIGVRQTSQDLLNIGFDFDRDAQSKNFYFVNSVWANSDFEGALMMRPVFGNDKKIGTNNFEIKKSDFSLFPNPATDELNIVCSDALNMNAKVNIEIYDISGRLILNVVPSNVEQTTINISNIPNGVYFIKLNSEKNIYRTQKFIIQR